MISQFKRLASVAGLAALMLFAGSVSHAATEVDENLPDYERVSGVSGKLSSIGSDTLNNLMYLWSESFKKQYPNVVIEVEGKGSSTAPPALTEGTSQLGPMSRPMKDSEIEAFEKEHGYKPTPIGVALDAVSVYVNKDNPIESLTLAEVDAIFSKTRSGGHPEDITTWGQVGLEGDWANSPISVYGRNSASGTYGYFKKNALFKGDYKDTVKEQPGSSAVVNGITEDLAGIGYSGIGYITSGVRAVPLAKAEGEEAYAPSMETVMEKQYPLGRMLYVYVAKEPGKPLDPVVEQFLTFVLSKEGQEIVVKDGYLPLNEKAAAKQLEALTK